MKSFLLPHDGSALSSRPAHVLAPLLSSDSKVTLLHVVSAPESTLIELETAAKGLERTGATVERRSVDSSDAAAAILDAANELRPDLVAMATHGRGGVQRMTHGSVAVRVLRHCPVPLLMTNPFTLASGAPIRSLLVSLDGSDASSEVLDSVIPLAGAFGARVTLLHVDFDAVTDTPQGAEKRRRIRDDEVRSWFEGALARLREAGLDASIDVAHGNVAEQILRRARPGAHDLLAMTTHGRSGPGRWLLGSTAEAVLRHCEIPTLLHRVGTVAAAARP